MASYNMLHEVKIKASPQKIFEAITTQKGLSSWWTSDVELNGQTLKFYFYNRTGKFAMKVEKSVKNKIVEWKCLGDDKEWKNTRLKFEITSGKEYSILKFSHSDWKSNVGYFRRCNTVWGHLMIVLKDYLEKKKINPYFK